MANGEGWLGGGYSESPDPALQCDLTVIPCSGWARRDRWHCPIAPSPNLPTAAAVQLYPHLVLLEATVASVGRGTPSPSRWSAFPACLGRSTGSHPNPMRPANTPSMPVNPAPASNSIAASGAWQAQGTRQPTPPRRSSPNCSKDGGTPRRETRAPSSTVPSSLTSSPVARSCAPQAGRGQPAGRIDGLWQEERETFLERRSRYLRYPAED